ncbi:MAG: SprT-like domain-containing protein [Anaerolineaceae bacterium]
MPTRKLSLRNLTLIIDDIQTRFQTIGEKRISGEKPSELEKKKLLMDIRSMEQTIRQRCRSHACQPADLSESSYRAFLWLVFLSKSQHFEQHLEFISRFLQEWRTRSNKTVTVKMYNCSFVFQCKPGRNNYGITIGEGFLTADEQIMRILIDCCLQSNRKHLTQLRKASRSPSYKQVMDAIWQHTAQSIRSTNGDFYDLQQLFQKINAEYFQNSLGQPRLCWSSRRATRRLGYYHPDTDTITLSCFLDQKTIPAYVVEYVLYHEMLHKKLGLKEVNSYRLAHTTQFKQQERKFKQYSDAERFLKGFQRT